MGTAPHTKIAYGVALGFTALVWFAPGCGKTSSDTTFGPDAGTAQESFADASACVPLTGCEATACPTNSDGGFGCYWACGQASLCASAHFTSSGNPCSSSGCAGGIDAAVAYTVDETNVRCILTAMRDGTIGEVMWGSSTINVEPPTDYEEDMDLITQRQAYGWWQYESDSYDYQRYAGRQLKAASYFQTCLDSNDVPTYLSCLQNAYEGCL
jgi:hypothetical protein